jgi:hypothetical protein
LLDTGRRESLAAPTKPSTAMRPSGGDPGHPAATSHVPHYAA